MIWVKIFGSMFGIGAVLGLFANIHIGEDWADIAGWISVVLLWIPIMILLSAFVIYAS